MGFKAKPPKPFVVSEVLHGKTGVVDLGRLDHKHFVDGWLAPIVRPPLETNIEAPQESMIRLD